MLKLKTLLSASLVLLALFGGSAQAADAGGGVVLATNDFVGISFWLATAIMLASTVFFFAERGDMAVKWRTSLTVAGLVTGVAFWHYLYMRGVWVSTGDSPTVYRYIDWLITVPLQIVEFYLILAAVTAVRTGLFWQLRGISCNAPRWLFRRNGSDQPYNRVRSGHGRVDLYHLLNFCRRG